jgi:hypothetical protein
LHLIMRNAKPYKGGRDSQKGWNRFFGNEGGSIQWSLAKCTWSMGQRIVQWELFAKTLHQRARTSKMSKKCDLTHNFGLRRTVYWKCRYCAQMSFLRAQPISQKECHLTHIFWYAEQYTKNVTCHIPMWHYT